MKLHRAGITLFAFCTFGFVPNVATATENDTGWWAEESGTQPEDPETADPASAMRLRILSVVDGYDAHQKHIGLSPCDFEQGKQRRFICWSNHGRNLHVMLPTLVWDMVYSLRPRTLYSYKSLDIRMPPSVRVRLPFNATTNFGYENDMLGLRIGLKF